MSTAIYCYNGSGGYFDLNKNTVISQTLKMFEIGDLTSRRFNFTNSISIPSTVNNDNLLGLINDEKSVSSIPYSKIIVKLEVDGITIVPYGLAKIRITEKGYSMNIISGSKNFFDLVGTKLLTDLNNLLLESSYSVTAGKRNSTTGIVYPVSSYKTFDNPEIQIKPFIYYHTIIDSIIADAGYTKSGAIFSDSKYLKKICSCWGSAKGYQDSFVKERTASAYISASQNIPISDNGVQHVVNFGSSFNLGNNPIGYWNSNKYRVDEPGVTAGYYMFAVNVKVEITIFVPPGYTIDLQIVDGNNNPIDVIASNVGSGTYSYDFVKQRSSVTGFTIDPPFARNGVANGVGVTAIYNSPAAGSTSIDVTLGRIEVTPLEIPIELDDGLGVHSMIYYSKLLPKIKQVDIMHDFAINYGVLFDEDNGVLICTTIDEIILSTETTDWTNKREPSIGDTIDFDKTIYSRKNIFSYQNGDGYSNAELGVGSFELDNDNLDDQKTVYQSIFDNSAQILASGITSLFTPTDEDYFGIYPKVNGAADVFKLALVRSKYNDESSFTYPNGGSYSNYFIAYFEDPQQAETLDFDQDLNTYYGSLVEVLNKLKVINRSYNLNPLDIYSFSFFIPIYDNGSKYLVNSIDNYINGKPTNVQLIKI